MIVLSTLSLSLSLSLSDVFPLVHTLSLRSPRRFPREGGDLSQTFSPLSLRRFPREGGDLLVSTKTLHTDCYNSSAIAKEAWVPAFAGNAVERGQCGGEWGMRWRVGNAVESGECGGEKGRVKGVTFKILSWKVRKKKPLTKGEGLYEQKISIYALIIPIMRLFIISTRFYVCSSLCQSILKSILYASGLFFWSWLCSFITRISLFQPCQRVFCLKLT